MVDLDVCAMYGIELLATNTTKKKGFSAYTKTDATHVRRAREADGFRTIFYTFAQCRGKTEGVQWKYEGVERKKNTWVKGCRRYVCGVHASLRRIYSSRRVVYCIWDRAAATEILISRCCTAAIETRGRRVSR